MSRPDTGGAEGVDFQLNIVAWALFRGHKLYNGKYEIYSEFPGAGKFDDVVLIYKDSDDKEHYRFLQAKHVRDEGKKNISVKDLTIGNKFNILKYFESFNDIVKNDQFKGKVQDVILFSNLDINKEFLPYLNPVLEVDPIFQFDQEKINQRKPQLYKLKANFIEIYRTGILRDLANALLDNCEQGSDTINNFKDYHGVLLKEVCDIGEMRFRPSFIERLELSKVTGIFRDVIEEEIVKRADVTYDSINWMKNAQLHVIIKAGKTEGKWPQIFDMDSKAEPYNEFCARFTLAMNQPNEQELNDYLIATNELNVDILVLRDELRTWFKDYNYPLNNDFVHELMAFQNIHKMKRALQEQRIEFTDDSFQSNLRNFLDLENNTKILQIKTSGDARGTGIKLQCVLKVNFKKDYLFTPPCKEKELRNILELFGKSQKHDLLIWETQHCAIDMQLLKDFHNQHHTAKKVIIVGNHTLQLNATDVGLTEDLIQRMEEETKYDQLTEDTRQRLESRAVTFQGVDIKLTELGSIDNALWIDLLQKDIVIGNNVAVAKEYNMDYYIHRTLTVKRPFFFKKHMKQLRQQFTFGLDEDEYLQKRIEYPKKTVHLFREQNDKIVWRRSMAGGLQAIKLFKMKMLEQSISDAEKDLLQQFDPCQKVFIITDPAGMGKTVISSHLAFELKRQNPKDWVIRLVAMENAATLSSYDATAPLEEFILSKLLKLASPIEQFLFSQYLSDAGTSSSKLIFIFDGYDEISGQCQQTIRRVLNYLNEKPNVRLIGITTRPQHQKELEMEYQQFAYTLTPFSKVNKIDFLQKFWTSTLGKDISGFIIPADVIKTFAELLIDRISEAISDNNSKLTGIPLQMRMLGDIYADHAREFMKSGGVVVPEISSVSIYDLYEQFIHLKKQIFLIEKTQQLGLAASEMHLKLICFIQSSHARSVILDGSKVDEELVDYTIYLGIIQKYGEGSYDFIHRTFAEFLTAQHLLQTYILSANLPLYAKFKKGRMLDFLVDKDLHVVRKFVNCKFGHAEMLAQFRRENDSNVKNYFSENYENILRFSASEETHAIFIFFLEMWWICNSLQMRKNLTSNKGGLLENLVLGIPSSLSVFLEWIFKHPIDNKNDFLRDLFAHIIRIYFENRPKQEYSEQLAEIIIKYQNELEATGVLEWQHLKEILFGLNEEDYTNTFLIKYLEYLQSKPKFLLYELLKENQRIAYLIILRGEKDAHDFLALLENDQEFISKYLYATLIESYTHHFSSVTFDIYVKFINKHIRKIDPDQLKKFRHLVNKSPREDNLNDEYSINYLKFHLNMHDLVPIRDILETIKIHKGLTFAENCALWGSDEVLQIVLDAGDDIEKIPTDLSQLSDLLAKIDNILRFIRTQYSADVLKELISTRDKRNNSFLSNAIEKNDVPRMDIFASWMDSEDMFTVFMKNLKLMHISAYIDFIVERIPEYKMKFFEINKRELIADEFGNVFNIVVNHKHIDEDELYEVFRLQRDDDGNTILHNEIRTVKSNFDEDSLNQLKCWDRDRILALFQIRNHNKETAIDMVKHIADNTARQGKGQKLSAFFTENNLQELDVVLKQAMAESSASTSESSESVSCNKCLIQ